MKRPCSVYVRSQENLGVADVSQNNIAIFPNPATGLLTIKHKYQVTKIEIYNKLGQKVFTDINKNVIDISVLPSGIYFIKIEGQSGIIDLKKIIKK